MFILDRHLLNLFQQIQLKILLTRDRQITFMSTKQSQLFLYFQNKAHHYQNIQAAKPKVTDRLDSSMNQTINHADRQKYNRDLPQNRRYEIEIQNSHMTFRLASIQVTPRKEVQVKGNYSRYNSFERKFRLKNWAQDEEQRQREIKNQKIQAKIASMKPQIGSNRFWQADYQSKTKMRREIRPSRGSLQLDEKSFMAEAYKDFLHQIHNNQSEKNINDISVSKSSKGEEKSIAIERLFVLPNLTARRSPKLKNSQVTVLNPQPIKQKKVQNIEPK